MFSSVSNAHLGGVESHEPVSIGCWHIWINERMSLSPQISASCNCKHSDNPPESWIRFYISLTSPVLKLDTLTSLLVVSPSWSLPTTRASINIEVAHFFSGININQTQIFTFIPWQKVVGVSKTASIGESFAWLWLLVKEPPLIVSGAKPLDPDRSEEFLL